MALQLHLCQCVIAVICVWGMFEIVMPSPVMTSGSRQKRQDPNMSASDNHTESIEGTKQCYKEQDLGQSYAGKARVDMDSEKCAPWSKTTNCPYHAFEPNFNTLLKENYCRNPDPKTGKKPWCYTYRDWGQCYQRECNVDVCSDESTISCGPPPAVSDGELIDAPQASYSVGDKVRYNCNLWSKTRERICLSSGAWSELGFVCSVCPDGWLLLHGKCYFKVAERLNFDNAKRKCTEFGAEIYSPRRKEESYFLYDHFRVYDCWIALKQTTTWQWLDGQPFKWNQWGLGYDMYADKMNICAVRTNYFDWKAVLCSKEQEVVCTVENNFAKDDAPCLDYSDACTLYFKDNANLCVKFPDFALAQCRFTCGLCDIDATPKCAVEAPGDNAIIMNGSSSDDISRGETVTYACQEGFDPLHGDIVRGCGASGKLVGTPLECSPGCEEGWTFLYETKSCYKYIDDPQDYFSARLFCKSLEGNLAMPKTLEQNVFVKDIWRASSKRRRDIWIGMNDFLEPNTFAWDDDEQLFYSHFASIAPSKKIKDNCGSMSSNGLWFDKECQLTTTFVCQVPKIKRSATINELKPCPEGWKLKNDTCFKLTAMALDYNNSRKVCELEDALIAMPKLSRFHNFLVNQFGTNIWLGVNDIVEEGVWVFEDGRPITFKKWSENQPPEPNEGKNCLTLDDDAKWVDVACEQRKEVVCQKPARDVGKSGNADQDPPVGESGNADLEPSVGESGNADLEPSVGA